MLLGQTFFDIDSVCSRNRYTRNLDSESTRIALRTLITGNYRQLLKDGVDSSCIDNSVTFNYIYEVNQHLYH